MAPSLPMFSRSSDTRTLALGTGCPAGWLFSHLFKGELPDMVWFVLGTSAHESFELSILEDLTLQEALTVAHSTKAMMLQEASKTGGVLESASARAKRSLATLDNDIETVVRNWFDTVPPGAPNRNKLFDEYGWPPRVEVRIEADPSDQPRIITHTDTIFEDGPKHRPNLPVDWKTGSTKKSHPAQIHHYWEGLRRMEGEDKYPADQKRIGAFYHVTHRMVQWVEDYWGDDVVQTQHREAFDLKVSMYGEKEPLYRPDWWCNYCQSRSRCPVYTQNQDLKLEIEARLDIASLTWNDEPTTIEESDET